MRVLFFLLLLANLTYLAWTMWVVPPVLPPGRQAVAQLDTPRVRLLREVMPDAASAGASGAQSSAALDAANCVSVGPFAEPAAAETMTRRLGELGYATRARAARETIWAGYLVRITNLATAEDAANALVALQARGVGEPVALRNEPPGTDVSLGVYGERSKADQVATASLAAGYPALVRDRLRIADVAWIDVDRAANGSLPGAEDILDDAARAAHIELRACPPSAAGATATANAAAAPGTSVP